MVLVELDNLSLISMAGCLPGDARSQIDQYHESWGLNSYNS